MATKIMTSTSNASSMTVGGGAFNFNDLNKVLRVGCHRCCLLEIKAALISTFMADALAMVFNNTEFTV